MLYKSCNVFHEEFKKIELEFSDFSTIFYGFSNFQPKQITISDLVYANVPETFPCITDRPSLCS
jgi:hypothetical protein